MGEYDLAVGRILDGAVTVMDRKGLQVGDEAARRALSGVAGVRVQDGRVFFRPQNVRDFLGRYQRGRQYRRAEEYTVSTMGHASHIVDLEGSIRPLTQADNDEMARLCDALRDRGVRGGAPGIPQDVPPPVRSISQFLSSAKNSRERPVWVGQKSLGNELLMKRCLEVLGLPYGIGLHVISPLKLLGQEVDVTFALFRRYPDLPVSIGSMPVIGLSTPMTVVSGFVISLAEVLAAGMIFDYLGAREVSIWLNLYPFEMKRMSFVYGVPANVALNRLEAEINRQVLVTDVASKSFKTMSQRPGTQACMQKAAFTGIMAECGKRTFSGAGCLSLDEIFSPVQLIYDCEILSYVKRVHEIREGLAGDERLLLDVILGNSADNYIEEPTTLQFCRELQWDSRIFPSSLLQQWNAAGRPDPETTAAALARKLTAERSFELDAGKAGELDALYRWAQSHVGEIGT